MSGHSQEIPLSGRRRVSRRFWETVRLALLLGDGASRVAFGRRRVSRRFWETAHLASILGDGASRVAFGRRRVSRRFWEAARLASLLKKFLSFGGAASEAKRGDLGYSAYQTTPPLRGTPPWEGNFRRGAADAYRATLYSSGAGLAKTGRKPRLSPR